MKHLILLTLLLGSLTGYGQTKKTSRGYTILVDGMYLRVDTIDHRTQVYNYTGKKVWVTVNEGKQRFLPKDQVMTVWCTSFSLTVTRKKYKQIYQF